MKTIAICFFLCLFGLSLFGQTFSIKEKGVFIPQNKMVLLLEDSSSRRLVMFKSDLNVNTDGTPLSYHPYDLLGEKKAINTIGNAVAIYKNDSKVNLFLNKKTFKEAIGVFEKFRDSNYDSIPSGYKIIWKNVLIPRKDKGIEKPCIITTGEYEGYFSSATSLKQGLKDNKGECDCDDQVNSLKVPSLVLAGGKDNILKKFGASLGDLVIAYNPLNDSLVFAIINDIGPKNNLGEGSVLLNMLLSGNSKMPKNRKEANTLGNKNIIITIIPKSSTYSLDRPYTLENIEVRCMDWLKSSGFDSENELLEFLTSLSKNFK